MQPFKACLLGPPGALPCYQISPLSTPPCCSEGLYHKFNFTRGSSSLEVLSLTRISLVWLLRWLQHTIEEKVIERAYKKLALDALVIQQGRLAEQKAVNKDELLQMVRYGAEKVFSSSDSSITDEDVDRILAKGEEAKAELDEKMKKFTQDAIKFKMDDCQCSPPSRARTPVPTHPLCCLWALLQGWVSCQQPPH